jgi:acetate---CoA ligase (ADP-forming)
VNASEALSRLLRPRSVALVGASADLGKTSGRPLAYLLKHGFTGQIFPVNPRVDRIEGVKCYPDIASLPEAPDVGIVLLGAERAHTAVRDLAQRGTACAMVLASGYAEVGEAGVRRQQELLTAAGSMRLLGPNTIGLMNLTDRIVLSASGALALDELHAGSTAVVSQSGGILGALLSRATGRGMGLSKLISTSNEADLDIADCIEHLASDEATQVIALYIEAIRHPGRFRDAVTRAREAGKSLVAFKIGRSESGARAALSHTGALAGSDRMYDALFEQLGIVRAESFSDLLDVPLALSTGRQLSGRRVAILTTTGGAGALVCDSLGMAGFTLPPPDEPTAKALQALQPGDQSALDRNPIDVTLAGLDPTLLRSAISTLLASNSYDALVVIVGSSSLAMPELMAGALQDCLPLSGKPVIAFVSPHAPQVTSLLVRRGIPAFTAPESCAAALAGLLLTSNRTAQPAGSPAAQIELPAIHTGHLDEAEAKQLFARFGIPCVREVIVRTSNEAADAARELGGVVVLKVLSSRIPHKSEMGGVAVGLTVDEIGERLQRMASTVESRAGFRPDRFLVQEKLPDGIELILGARRDSLGTAILLGTGGVMAEVVRDTTMTLIAPGHGLSLEQAREMPRRLKSWPLLQGFRGRPATDLEALARAIVAFSEFAARMEERLQEAEINPLFVFETGMGVRAADALIVISGN